MESQIKSSFIPQDVGRPAASVRRTGSGGELLVLGAIILVVASVALGASVFLYTQYLNNAISSQQQSIDRARAAIEPSLIDELTRLDQRMKTSDTLLQQHVAPSILFNYLEQVTLQSVTLKSLEMKMVSPTKIELTMKGAAASVNGIALQSDLLGKSGLITSPIFSDINRGADGLMDFQVNAGIDPSSLRYEQLVSGGQPAAGAQLSAPQQSSATNGSAAGGLPQSSAPATSGTQATSTGAASSAAASVPTFTPTQ
ncbi:MAG TPA: hypothetical protein VFL98_03310 [Candidatus Paceibacterota bacterium]|nr:hypothetical protein [Candidatus Paceibacterota bacterium]